MGWLYSLWMAVLLGLNAVGTFYFCLCFLYLRGVNEQQAGLYDYDFVHLIACCNRIVG